MSFEANIEAVRKTFAAIPERLTVNLKTALGRAGVEHRKLVADDNYKLATRSRQLKDSFGSEVQGSTLGDLQVRVFSAGVPYARIQEHGGEVRPKNAKNLTIPLKAALTGAGVPRYPGGARQVIAENPDRAFFFTTRDGRTFLALRDPQNKAVRRGSDKGTIGTSRERIALMYRLVKRSTIPPRLQFRKSWDQLQPRRAAQLGDAVRKSLREASSSG